MDDDATYWRNQYFQLRQDLGAARGKLAELGYGYWKKSPCDKHTTHFNLECPACNARNAEWVDATPK